MHILHKNCVAINLKLVKVKPQVKNMMTCKTKSDLKNIKKAFDVTLIHILVFVD